MGLEPEAFDCITLFFSDIVGFTRISALSKAMDIVVMLNNMYTLFDDISHRYDVYKVATIGDAYMVGSGVPVRNGDRHAEEVCSMALALLHSLNDFIIPHLLGERLHMRCGIHSGPCVAGVTGLKMPRYLLFGDTVDIAAKMESSGEAMKIHVSETTQSFLRDDHRFLFTKKESIDFKGKGEIACYWLMNA